MAQKTRVEQIVESAVTQALESQIPQLREQLVARVLEQVQPLLGESGGSSGTAAADLLKAISVIQAGTTQKEILRALLDGTSLYCGRAALFVVKGGSATGWQGRAFENNDDVKDFALDVDAAAPAQVLRDRNVVSTNTGDMDAQFISQFGAPASDQIILLPLRLKDKVAALVYADGGTESGGAVDGSALELLVVATSAWLEVASLRKQAAKETSSDAGAEPAAPVQTVSSYSDPFAGHAPGHSKATPALAEEPVVAAAAAASSGTGAAAAPAQDAFAQMSVEDADVHRKAQRFARLLMDEVKLYNQAKVAEGRKHKDLYDRLKEDIEKSRSTYNKRYGNTVAASGDHFNNEVVRSLAEDDASLLGPNFRR